MRFFENGPAIPDELLHARDKGRVVFFCGAGVSRAKAKLPDFFGLAKKVMKTLGVQADSPARKLLEEAYNVEAQTGVAGVIPADRIFGLLEREFSTDVIEAEVASALRPDDEPDLTAHNTILDLATTRENLVHVVTTNFDRLFDDCGHDLLSWQRPRLPDPSRPKDMDGIVYLHGKVTPDYKKAEDAGFVLSSSQFGQAYLSEGWATSFFREIVERYVVVFVGYAADDPPVHYLLEGLNRQIKDKERQVYAFQPGNADDAVSKWGHRGVKAIAYAEDSGHTALWDTLEAWAQRARDLDKWYAEIINKAKQGPQSLSPHERGQVAHIVSTVEGVRKFSEEEEPPPAEWLCVFDKYRRYGEPGKLGSWLEEGPDIDPFDLYRIDSDVPPDKANSRDRKPPADAWDAFNLSRVDKTNLSDGNFPSITGRWAYNVPPLPSQLRQMGEWIKDVAGQPAAVWWAVRQPPLHPDIRRTIRLALTDSQRPISPAAREAWYYLLEYWEQGRDRQTDVVGWHELKRRILRDGWSRSVVRAYAACSRPYLIVEPSRGFPKPPEQEDELSHRDLIDLDVVYPADNSERIPIPNEWVTPVVVVLRKNLEAALELETEIDRGGLGHISSIVPDQSSDSDHKRRLSGAVIEFISVFEHLIQIDLKAARREFSKWPIEDDVIFTRLRIWSAGKPDLVSDAQFGSMLADVSDDAFWDRSHEWDLMHSLLVRWDGLSDDTRAEIEKRLLKGRSRRKKEEEDDFEKWCALSILASDNLVIQKGCKLNLNLKKETDRFRESVPDWKPKYADEIIAYSGVQSGSMSIETDCSALLDIPLASVLSKARSLSGRREEPFVEYNPFAGLSADRPVRAFSALRIVAKEGDFPAWAWSTFLNLEKRKTDKPRFMMLIAERLACYLDNGKTVPVEPVANWLLNVSNHLSDESPASFHRVTSALIQALKDPENRVATAIVFNAPPEELKQERERELVQTAAQTAQAVAQALFHTQKTDLLKYADELLALPTGLRRHVLAMFARWTNRFYGINREWSKKNLLSALDSSDLGDRDAFWEGFQFPAQVSQELFIHLKPYLLQLAKDSGENRREHIEGLSSIIVAGWRSIIEETNNRCVSSEEFRAVLVQTDDEFRSHVLWQIGKQSRNAKESTKNEWKSLLPEFLRDVWPYQRKAESSAMSVSLCDLVFSNEELFPELVEIILTRLTKIDVHDSRWSKAEKFGKKYPCQTLDLLYAVLPDNVLGWPYDIEDIFTSISENEPSLKTDEKLLELKRRWDSR